MGNLKGYLGVMCVIISREVGSGNCFSGVNVPSRLFRRSLGWMAVVGGEGSSIGHVVTCHLCGLESCSENMCVFWRFWLFLLLMEGGERVRLGMSM